MDQAVIGLRTYITISKERLLTAARTGMTTAQENCKEFKKRRQQERSEELKGKKLHSQFIREMQGVAGEKNWEWLEKNHLKKNTEGLIMASQTQSLRTDAMHQS